MARLLHSKDKDFAQNFARFLQDRESVQGDVRDVVAGIIADVRAKGDDALREYTTRFDKLDLGATIRLQKEVMKEHAARCPANVREALELAAKRIRAFHETQKPKDTLYTDDAGVTLGVRWSAVSDVGLYVPGGKAAYPSSVLMNAIPAKVAGVERLVVAVPMPLGEVNPAVMAALEIAGVDEVYPMGGAQAVAAMAYGTPSIPPVHVIVGPGNAYVAEAKRQVFGVVGIDMVAGPSEILVIADDKNDAGWIAADLLSQAEHDSLAQSILITDSESFAQKAMAAVEATLEKLPRKDIASASWHEQGAVIVVEDMREAARLTDILAPEHLELAVDNPQALAATIRNAGAMFLGRYTPEAIGDYVAGPSHVLPTSRTARFSSALTVTDFMKRSSIIQCTPQAFGKIAPAGEVLANAEGLQAHALSLSVRLKEKVA